MLSKVPLSKNNDEQKLMLSQNWSILMSVGMINMTQGAIHNLQEKYD